MNRRKLELRLDVNPNVAPKNAACSGKAAAATAPTLSEGLTHRGLTIGASIQALKQLDERCESFQM